MTVAWCLMCRADVEVRPTGGIDVDGFDEYRCTRGGHLFHPRSAPSPGHQRATGS